MRAKHVSGVLLSILLVTSLIALPSFIITMTSQTASANPSENFIIVALPDTQNYSKSYPTIFDNQTNWIVQNENSQNIVFVAHLGDIINDYNQPTQWQNANASMRILDNKVLYGILPGNHDLGIPYSGGDGGAIYESWFPLSRYSYWDGSYVGYGPDNNLNNYQLFSAGGMDFIVLDLQYNPPTEVLNWAGNVLDNYSSRRAIITTHSYLTYPGNLSDNTQGGQKIYYNLVVPHNNVFLVLCGHSYNSTTDNGYGTWERIDNFGGRIVYGLLSDYQNIRNPNDGKICGNGYLRIMKFVPSENKIYVKTYSPWLDSYMTNSPDQLVLTYPMNVTVVRSVSVSISPSSQDNFPGGVLGYTVMVTNTGNISDNYSLAVSDDAGWGPTLDNYALGAILPSGNGATTLRVTIPDNAIPGTRENMTVTVTSQSDNTVGDNARCTANVLNPLRVGVSISPSDNLAENGQTVNFTVTIKNLGAENDNYNLTVSDDLGWGPSLLENMFINVGPSENRQTTLSVTIPGNAVPRTSDNISVIATSQADNTLSDNASCIASVLPATINLLIGWNLVCFTAAGATDTPNNLFAPLAYVTDYVMYYWNAPGGPYSQPSPTTAVQDNRGYWVNMITTPKAVMTTGTKPVSRDIHLVMGWNLVGFPVVNEITTPNNIFAPLVYAVDYVMYFWNAPGGPYSQPDPTKALKDNTGYWVNMITASKTVTVPYGIVP